MILIVLGCLIPSSVCSRLLFCITVDCVCEIRLCSINFELFWIKLAISDLHFTLLSFYAHSSFDLKLFELFLIAHCHYLQYYIFHQILLCSGLLHFFLITFLPLEKKFIAPLSFKILLTVLLVDNYEVGKNF